MLLGSFVPEYDEDEGAEEDPFNSPRTDLLSSPTLAQQTFGDDMTMPDTMNGAGRASSEHTVPNVRFSSPSLPNRTRSFQMVQRK